MCDLISIGSGSTRRAAGISASPHDIMIGCIDGGRTSMRIAIMAAGAVGGYFGGRLAAAGHDVAFLARGARRDAIRRDGLKIESALGDLHLNDVNVTDDPRQVGPVDLVLFAVKLWDTEAAGDAA